MRYSYAEINLPAVVNNVRLAKSRLRPGTKLCAVVKANAYGHGAVQIARRALNAGADYLAVAFVQEAVELRQAGIIAPILILGTLEEDAADDIVRYDLDQTVYTQRHLAILNEAATILNKPARIQIKIDTGMHRIGILPSEAGFFARELKKYNHLQVIGAFSHFAMAEADDKDFADLQFQRYMQAIGELEKNGIHIPLRHICNSAGIQELAKYQLDMVRQGITLYGLLPDRYKEEYSGLQPVMRIKSKIAYIKTIEPGETVGYDRTYTATQPTKVATVPIGYADGFIRSLGHNGIMVIRGQRVPIIGRVCMDQVMLNVSNLPNVQIGDDVLVAGGPELPLEEMAERAHTICYELACLFSVRLPIVYKED